MPAAVAAALDSTALVAFGSPVRVADIAVADWTAWIAGIVAGTAAVVFGLTALAVGVAASFVLFGTAVA